MPVSVLAAPELQRHFIEHRGRLCQAARRIVGCRQRAEDVVQDAYLKINAAPPPAPLQQPVAYLFRIVRNLAIDRQRRAAFEAQVFGLQEEGDDAAGDGATPESILMACQCLRALSRALAELPPRTRAVFTLHRLGEQTQREIAAYYAISPTLVNFMIRAATSHCRDCLDG